MCRAMRSAATTSTSLLMFLKYMGLYCRRKHFQNTHDVYRYDRDKAEGENLIEPVSPTSPTSPETNSTNQQQLAGSDEPSEVSSVIRLQNGMVLYLREINKYIL